MCISASVSHVLDIDIFLRYQIKDAVYHAGHVVVDDAKAADAHTLELCRRQVHGICDVAVFEILVKLLCRHLGAAVLALGRACAQMRQGYDVSASEYLLVGEIGDAVSYTHLFAGVIVLVIISFVVNTKKNVLLNLQLGDFFHSELQSAFGPGTAEPTMLINVSFLKGAELIDQCWEGSDISNFFEGEHDTTRFSVANVTLDHLVEERSGPDNDCLLYTSRCV